MARKVSKVVAVHKLLLKVFTTLEQEKINYCLLRDFDELEGLAGGGEVDLLVRADQLPGVRRLLAPLGFAGLPSRGYEPHHFFLAYDQESDCWLKLDIVTEITYGRPIPTLQTTLAANCLANRRHCPPTFIPSPEDELLTLLLHCVLDKGYFKPERQRRLRELRRQVTNESYLSALLATYWSAGTQWSQLAAMIDGEQWAALLSQEKAVAGYLAGRNRLSANARFLRGRLLRKTNRWLGWLRPRARTVALLAPDGAGKSTLAAGIENTFYFPVEQVYMGLYQQGRRAGRGRLAGLGLLGRLVTQWQRYLRARYYQAQGRLVIFDRYTYDALLPPYERLRGPKQWRRWLLAHACPAPDLVLILDAPGELLYNRKQEHNTATLEEQRQGYLNLLHHLRQGVVLDASCDAETVRRRATALIWQHYFKNPIGAM